MSEELHYLLAKSFSNDISPEERQQVTDTLLSIYQSPQSTIDIIEFLLNEQNIVIRQAAAIGFKKSLSNNWEEISMSEFHEPVKEGLINIFINEKNKQIRHMLVQASTPIFASDADDWPALFELVTNLTDDKTKYSDIEFSMYLITYFSSHLSQANIEANFQFFLDLCNFSFETQNTELIDTACGLVAVLIKLIAAEDMPVIETSFTKMLDIYLYTLSTSDEQSNENAISITNKVAFAFENDNYPIPNEAILTKLFDATQYDPILAFNPIIEFIETCGRKLTDSFDEIIERTFSIASSLFIDDSLEGNENSMYVLLAVEKMSTSFANPRVFLPKLLKMLPTSTPQETVISAMTISRVIQTSKEAIVKNISPLSKLIFDTLQIDQLCAKEVALDIIKGISKLFEEGKSDISSQFMQPIISLLECDQPDLIKHVLSTFKSLLNCTDIDTNLIGPVLQILSKLIESPNVLTAHVLDVISALVFSAGEDVAPYVEVLLPLIIQTASISEDDDPMLKANSIEALSNILRFANLSDELINQSLDLIVKSGQTADYDIRGSVMSSISNILVSKLPQVINFSEPIQELISVYINEEITSEKDDVNYDDDDDDDVESQFLSNQNQLNSLTNTYLLIKNIYKLYPQLGPEDPTPWFHFCNTFMVSSNDDLTVAATRASVYMLLAISTNLDPSEFWNNLKKNLDNVSDTVTSCSFNAISRFLENDFPTPDEIIQFAVENGTKGLLGKLDCQDEDAEPSDLLTLSMQINRFFAEIATKNPELFPINVYIDYENQIGKNSGEFEISQCIGVLRQLYINSGEGCKINLASLQKKIIIKSFFSTLSICDFTVLPEPLIALKNVLERDSEIIVPKIQEVLEFIDNLFNCENDGEMHYWSTMTNAVSFLCTLMRMNLESFDLENWLPRILAVLPVKGDEMEAENIYGTLVWLIRSTPAGDEVIKSFGPEFIRIFAQTFGLKDKNFSLFKLSDETIGGMAQILLDLLGNAEGASELFEQSFQDDPDSQTRCQDRLQSIQQQQQ